MKVTLTVKADDLKLAQLLEKFSEQYRINYTLKRKNGEFTLQLQVNADDYGEFVRRLNLLKDCTYKTVEIQGGTTYNLLNIRPTKTNVDALIGKETVAQTDIDPLDGGIAKIQGELWFCRPEHNNVIKQGTRIRVVRVEGVSLIVEEVKE
ncbi:MAG: NfeD family protein, partial [Candidatus Bathyarchaeia archaeon]